MHTIKRTLNLIAIFLVFWVSACVTETKVLEPSPSPEPETTDLATPTINWFPATATTTIPAKTSAPTQETPIIQPLEDILFEDDFSDESLWQTRNETDARISFEPNALSVVVSGEKAEAYSISSHILPDAFYLEFTIETALCSEGDQYGIIFWRNSSSGTFRFWANCQGEIMVDRILPEGITQLIKWETARKFIPNAPARNAFGIQAKDGQLDFFVNDSYQFSLQTRASLEGAIGIIARTASDADLTVRFSELIVSKPSP